MHMCPDYCRSCLVTQTCCLIDFQHQTVGFTLWEEKDEEEGEEQLSGSRGSVDVSVWMHAKTKPRRTCRRKKIQYLCLYMPFCARLFFFSSLQFPPSGVSVSDRLPLFFHLLLSLFMSLFLSELQLGCKETVIHLPRIKQGCQQPDRHTKVLKLSPPSPSPSLPLTHTHRERNGQTQTQHEDD